MKILVTGNMGYVGPVLSKRLRKIFPDAFLVGMDTGYFGGCISNFDRLPETRFNQQNFVDMRDIPTDLLKDVDVVVHLAGISNDPIGNLFEQVTNDINLQASKDLAVAAKAAGVRRFVFASSCSMYGAAEDRARTEDSPLNPLTAYAKSKVFTERDLKPLASDTFKVTCLRFSTACGMSDRLRLDLVLNDFVAAAIASKKILILSDGSPWRPLINVKDMALAIDWAIQRSVDEGGPFLAVNIGSNEWNYQVKDLARTVSEIIPDVEISINQNAQPDKRSYRVNFDLFRKIAPKFQPRYSLIDTVKELKTGLEAIHFNDKDFHNTRWMRLKVLSELIDAGLLNDKLEWVIKN